MGRRDRVTSRDLVRTGAGTPGGEWLRRYWLAVGLAAELGEVPQAVRVLGEDLVLFRDGEGRPGLLAVQCPHRGTSLVYGDVEPAGLRCIYHGWLFDVHGACLEQPAAPRGSRFHRRVRQVAYPVQELGGLLFAYLGPDRPPPPLPRYAPLLDRPDTRQFEPVRRWDFNWFNFWENALDGVHLWVLHRDSAFGAQSWGNRFFDPADPPTLDFEETEFGVRMLMRKPGPTPDTEFVDAFAVILPSVIQFSDTEFSHLGTSQDTALEGQNKHAIFLTPNDDDHFMLFTVDYYTGPDPEFFAKLRAARAAAPEPGAVAPADPRPHLPFRGYVRREDYVAQRTQGTLGERPERLGVEDRGIIILRRLVREAIESVGAGERPRGVLSPDEATRIVEIGSYAGVRPRATSPHAPVMR
jgi:phenylpropionate dioxygenase-like ring-hydroxylating dioxygenase large terminal subunit